MTSSFSKAWRYRSDSAKRKNRKTIKTETVRLNRRNGKRFLEDAPVNKLNERDVI